MKKHLLDGTVIEGTAEEILEYERLRTPVKMGIDAVSELNYDHFFRELVPVGSSSTCTRMYCPLCKGTGAKADGASCIHFVACYCPACTPSSHGP